MKRLMVAVLFASATFTGASALADDTFESGVTEYNMDQEFVRGEVVGPNGAVVRGDQPRKQHSLIKVRGNFIPQMLKSVEDI